MNIPQKRLDFLELEIGVFFHFGIRTFYEGHVDWDEKEMPAVGFDPKELDCDQWIKAAKAGGAKYAILVCKHHDGFANWPSKYTEYSVKATPWLDGKGDIVKSFCDACRKHELQVGLYYSPAQFGSKNQDSKDYDNYFLNQISELLTNYGKIDYLWFDGCGSENHKYDTDRITKEIRRMQPEILIFNMWDPDTRWVGNEGGIASMYDKAEVDSLSFSVLTEKDDTLDETQFLPAECDCRIREQWFYSDADKPYLKSLDELWGLYLNSVGHGANLLLNIAPDRRGLIMEEDAKRFEELKQKIDTELSDKNIIAQNFTFDESENSFTCNLDEDKLVKYVVIDADLLEDGRVDEFTVGILPTQFGGEKVIFSGGVIGRRVICPIVPVAGRGLKITLKSFTGEPKFKSMKVYGCDRF